MANFDEALTADAKLFLTALGAETITYRPKAGADRQILAIIERDPPEPLPAAPMAGMGKSITIQVANRATAIVDDEIGGISSSEINTGGDQAVVALRRGQSAQARPIVNILEQDAGMMLLQVR